METSLAPFAPASFTATTVAPGATPVRGWLPDAAPSPAAIPAITVPWPKLSTVLAPSPERSGPCMTRPWRSCTSLTPVSRTAMPTPLPVLPVCRQVFAACDVQTYGEADRLSSQEEPVSCTARSAVTATTPPAAASEASRSAGTEAARPLMMGRVRRCDPPAASVAARTRASAPGRPETTTFTERCPVLPRPGSRATGRGPAPAAPEVAARTGPATRASTTAGASKARASRRTWIAMQHTSGTASGIACLNVDGG